MPRTVSTVRTLPRQLELGHDEDMITAMRRIDRDELDAVRRHLLGELAAPGPAQDPQERA